MNESTALDFVEKQRDGRRLVTARFAVGASTVKAILPAFTFVSNPRIDGSYGPRESRQTPIRLADEWALIS